MVGYVEIALFSRLIFKIALSKETNSSNQLHGFLERAWAPARHSNNKSQKMPQSIRKSMQSVMSLLYTGSQECCELVPEYCPNKFCSEINKQASGYDLCCCTFIVVQPLDYPMIQQLRWMLLLLSLIYYHHCLLRNDNNV